MSTIIICGVSRGRYTIPEPIVRSKEWEDEGVDPVQRPVKFPCGHPEHWEWGKGTRNGQKLYYPTEEMFFQKWHLTDEEMNEAIEQYDVFSLEMRGRIICKNCADHESINFKS
jgi:hypothetical protein